MMEIVWTLFENIIIDTMCVTLRHCVMCLSGLNSVNTSRNFFLFFLSFFLKKVLQLNLLSAIDFDFTFTIFLLLFGCQCRLLLLLLLFIVRLIHFHTLVVQDRRSDFVLFDLILANNNNNFGCLRMLLSKFHTILFGGECVCVLCVLYACFIWGKNRENERKRVL